MNNLEYIPQEHGADQQDLSDLRCLVKERQEKEREKLRGDKTPDIKIVGDFINLDINKLEMIDLEAYEKLLELESSVNYMTMEDLDGFSDYFKNYEKERDRQFWVIESIKKIKDERNLSKEESEVEYNDILKSINSKEAKDNENATRFMNYIVTKANGLIEQRRGDLVWKEDLERIKKEALEELKSIEDPNSLKRWKEKYLGSEGEMNNQLKLSYDPERHCSLQSSETIQNLINTTREELQNAFGDFSLRFKH